MAEVLIVTWDGGGNVPPALNLAAELRRRGHAVRFLGHEQQRAKIEAAGSDSTDSSDSVNVSGFTAYRHARPWSPTADNGLHDFLALCTDPGQASGLVETIGGADLVIVDCMCLPALRAALDGAPPVAVLVHSFHQYFAHRWAGPPIGLYCRLRGLPPRRLWNRADVVLVAADRTLDPELKVPPNVLHTGPMQEQPADPADHAKPVRNGRPNVLVSLSTVNFPAQPAALQRIVDAIGELDVDATVTTGPAVAPETVRAPANVTLLRWAPHAELMPRASLVVGHGGHATTMLALAHDLPLLLLPMHPMLDQPMVARAAAAEGAGLVLPPRAPASRIRDALQTLIDDQSYPAAAARVGARIRAAGGASQAADRLEHVLVPTALPPGNGGG